MMNKLKKPGRIERALGLMPLLVAAFFLTQPQTGTAQITGSGTAGNIPKFTGSTPSSTVGNSIITELNGGIGIGTTSPANVLHVVGPANTSAIFEGGATAHSLIQFRNGVNSRGYFGFVNFGSTGLGFLNAAGGTTNMLLTDNGKLGIGTDTPLRLLHLRDTSPTAVFTGTRISTSIDGSDPAYEMLHETANKGFRWRLGNGISSDLFLDYTTTGFTSYTPYLSVLNNGNVGIGTTNPWLKLNVWAGRAHVASLAEPYALGVGRTDAAGTYWLGTSAAANPDLIFSNNGGVERARITDTGRLGVGTAAPSTSLHVVGAATITGSISTGALSVTGNITATGSVTSTYQDVAEWVPANRAMSAGTVVTLDPEHSNLVVASSHSYDTRVAGVVSEKPGVILGEGGEGKVMIATTGRVRVKVDAANGPIRVGDLLVTSDKEGIAMRSQPIEIAGTPFHRPGTLIGKALEPLEKGAGEILVLLSLQ